MRPITVYEANDGSHWNTAGDAERRDDLLRTLAEIDRLLAPPVGNREGYVQQKQEAVAAYKAALCRVARTVTRHLMFDADPATIHRHGIAGRIIDDGGCEPLYRAWWRLLAT